MTAARIIFGCLLILVHTQQSWGQNVLSVDWGIQLRAYLKLDKPLIADSSFTFVYGEDERKLYISRLRPEIDKAKNLLDTLVVNDLSKIDIARLVTILQEYDIRYLEEYGFNSDYFFNVYHRAIFARNLKPNSELEFIEYFEFCIKLIKLKNASTATFLKIAMGRDSSILQKESAMSLSWRRFGRVNVGYYIDYVERNLTTFKEDLIQLAKEELTKEEAYSFLHLIGLFNQIPPRPVNCDTLSQFFGSNTSCRLVEAMHSYNLRWNNQECITTLLSQSNCPDN